MNSWQLKEQAVATLAKEVGSVRKPHGDRLRVALAFPNTYYVGMSNLGFQAVYRLFNAYDEVVCERIFLPPKQQLKDQLASRTRLITLESQTPVGDFDVIAFSVSFEWDYTNILTMLRLAGVPIRAASRTARDPLIVLGGAVTFVNPEPLAPFVDVVAAGEGEELVPGLIDAFREGGGRIDLLRALAARRGSSGRRRPAEARPRSGLRSELDIRCAGFPSPAGGLSCYPRGALTARDGRLDRSTARGSAVV